VEILQLHAFKSSLHRLPYGTNMVAPVVFKITPRHGPRRSVPFPTVSLQLRADSLLRERVYRVVACKRCWYICLSRDRRIVMALHATICRKTCIISSSSQKHLGRMIIKIFRIFYLKISETIIRPYKTGPHEQS
jgi:hypothetical protein